MHCCTSLVLKVLLLLVIWTKYIQYINNNPSLVLQGTSSRALAPRQQRQLLYCRYNLLTTIIDINFYNIIVTPKI